MKAAHAEAAQPVDPWRLPLERVRGKTGSNGVEHITTQMVLDVLGVEQRKRTAGEYRRLAKLMAELGWRPIRVRDLNGRGFREQIRGYMRDARAVE
jgi:hypothetical protein